MPTIFAGAVADAGPAGKSGAVDARTLLEAGENTAADGERGVDIFRGSRFVAKGIAVGALLSGEGEGCPFATGSVVVEGNRPTVGVDVGRAARGDGFSAVLARTVFKTPAVRISLSSSPGWDVTPSSLSSPPPRPVSSPESPSTAVDMPSFFLFFFFFFDDVCYVLFTATSIPQRERHHAWWS